MMGRQSQDDADASAVGSEAMAALTVDWIYGTRSAIQLGCKSEIPCVRRDAVSRDEWWSDSVPAEEEVRGQLLLYQAGIQEARTLVPATSAELLRSRPRDLTKRSQPMAGQDSCPQARES